MKLSDEKILFNNGHTFYIVEYNNRLYGYMGHVDFQGIDLYIGEDVNSFKYHSRILNNRRWAVCIIINNKFHLFCTSVIDKGSDYYRFQNIHRYKSYDGINFTEKEIVTDGSAPWIMKHNDNYYLFYHRKTDRSHDILAKYSDDITNLKNEKETVVDSIPITHLNETLSAPSIINIGGKFCALFESVVSGNPWETLYAESLNILGPYKLCGVFLNDDRACAFQHILRGKYILTYSKKTKGIWDVRYRTEI